MKRILLNIVATLALALLPTFTVATPAYAAAVCPADSSSRGQVFRGIGQAPGTCDDTGVKRAIHAAVVILSIVVGVAAVIMVILAGFKYITSGGESGRVANAKNTLIYALVGLAVAALAQFLVHFVLNQATHP